MKRHSAAFPTCHESRTSRRLLRPLLRFPLPSFLLPSNLLCYQIPYTVLRHVCYPIEVRRSPLVLPHLVPLGLPGFLLPLFPLAEQPILLQIG